MLFCVMAKLDKTRKLARDLYINDGMSQKDIAEYLQTSTNNISRWKLEEDWDKYKNAQLSTKDAIVTMLLEQNRKILENAEDDDRTLDSKESDIILKNAKAIQALSKEVNIVSAIQVFKQFNQYLLTVDPKLAGAITDPQRKFIIQLNQGE